MDPAMTIIPESDLSGFSTLLFKGSAAQLLLELTIPLPKGQGAALAGTDIATDSWEDRRLGQAETIHKGGRQFYPGWVGLHTG
jgi:hypothetical protein